MNLSAILSFFHVLWAVPLILESSSRSADITRFEVQSLPGSPSLPRSWAGRLPVPYTKDGNEMFFWLFEAEDPAYDDNLISGCSCRRIM